MILMKLLKAWRAVARADQEQTDSAAQVAAAVSAYHAALAEHQLDPDTSFSLATIADSDGDGDAGDPSVLVRVCDRYADWYVLVEGASAKVIAFYAYVYDGWAEEEAFAYSETDAGLLDKHVDAIPATREARDEWIVKALDGEPDGSEPVAKGYVAIVKSEAQRYTLGVAYPHSEVDSHGDFTDEVELETAAWNFMRSVVAKGAGGVGTDHADGTDDSAQVVESYIWRGEETTFGEGDDAVTVKPGDWMVGAIWTDEAWPRVEKGELTGWSIQGMALIDPDATLEAE